MIIPLTLREANEFIVRRHRHLGKAAGCKFALGLADEKRELIGVAVCGRPVRRNDALPAEMKKRWVFYCK